VPVKFSLHHVLGHQDEKTAIKDLPRWETQMNSHADACATNHRDNWSKPSKIVLFMPASKASISIDFVTITRNALPDAFDWLPAVQTLSSTSRPRMDGATGSSTLLTGFPKQSPQHPRTQPTELCD
jgi:hypothetical protein